jgi:hypothetical protein
VSIFACEYVLDGNGTAAAIRAGFSERTAKTQAWQLLDMPAVKAEVERLQAAAADSSKQVAAALGRTLGRHQWWLPGSGFRCGYGEPAEESKRKARTLR